MVTSAGPAPVKIASTLFSGDVCKNDTYSNSRKPPSVRFLGHTCTRASRPSRRVATGTHTGVSRTKHGSSFAKPRRTSSTLCANLHPIFTMMQGLLRTARRSAALVRASPPSLELSPDFGSGVPARYSTAAWCAPSSAQRKPTCGRARTDLRWRDLAPAATTGRSICLLFFSTTPTHPPEEEDGHPHCSIPMPFVTRCQHGNNND